MTSTFLLAVLLVAGQDHQHGVDKRGDKVMGFPHDKTTHHFRLHADGGEIEVEANESADAVNRDLIRQHLGHIAKKFAAGDFSAPMMIHDQNPPGVPTMTLRKDKISYRYEELPRGARVRMVTKDKESLEAIHKFLKFQISDHHTGDSGKIE